MGAKNKQTSGISLHESAIYSAWDTKQVTFNEI
jgi:hypothetical protein